MRVKSQKLFLILFLSTVILMLMSLAFNWEVRADVECSASPTGYHDLNISETEATCTSPASYTEYCSYCGTVTDSWTDGSALGHSYTYTVTTAATCTTDGVRTGTCSRCGDTITETISALGHDLYTEKLSDATCTTAETWREYCANGCGYSDTFTVGSVSDHSWTSYYSYLSNSGCYYTYAKTCTSCGATGDTTSFYDHDYSYTTTKAATCTSTGTQTGTCTSCYATTTKTIAALGHDYTDNCSYCGASSTECIRCTAAIQHSVSEPSRTLSFTYNGSTKTPIATGKYYTLSGTTSAVNYGNYSVTVTLDSTSRHKWSDGTTSAKTYSWSIAKASFSPTVNMTGYIYNGTKNDPTISNNTSGGTVTYYYNTTDSNSGGTAWSTVTDSRSLNANKYYMYAVVSATTNYNQVTSATKEFTIKQATGSLKFDPIEVTIEYDGETNFTNEVKIEGDGKVEYSSSNTNVATVNSTSGLVTVIAPGTTTITATITQETNYAYSPDSVSYTLTVEEKKALLMERGDTQYVIGYNRAGGSTDYKSELISTITLQGTLTPPTAYTNADSSNKGTWDVSVDNDGTVIAWIVKNGSTYDLYIGAELDNKRKIIAPENSSNLFANYTKCTQINNLNLLDTSKITNMGYMFNNCKKLTSLSLTNFDTSNVTNMSYIFSECSGLTSLNLSAFTTNNVTNMSNMFNNCNSLTTLDVSKFNTAKVTNMGSMFKACNSLTSLNVSNFNTNNVTDMPYMFSSCSNLTSILLGNNFDKINGTNMFSGCTSLSTIITTRATPMELSQDTGVETLTTLYVPTQEAETAYENKEIYLTVFENGKKVRPILELIGEKNYELNYKISYTEQGMTVAGSSNKNADNTYTAYGYTVTGAIIKRDGTSLGTVSAGQAGTYVEQSGTYTLTYELYDSSNAKVMEVTRTVIVLPGNYTVASNFYATLSSAYEAITSANGTIVVEQNNEDDSTFTIESGKTIILDTNGKTITKTVSGLTNNGRLTIQGTGTIKTTTLENLITNSNTLTVISGNLENKIGNAILNESGTLTIGVNDGNVQNEYPAIRGGTNGVYSSAVSFYFNDGILKGKSAGHIGNLVPESGYGLQFGTETIDAEIYNTEILAITNWSDGKSVYTNLEDAFNKVKSGSTIVALKDITDSSTNITLNKTIELDLDGHIVSIPNSSIIVGTSGSLEIVGETGSKLISGRDTVIINNGGTVKLGTTDGDVSDWPKVEGNKQGVSGNLIMNSGTLIGTNNPPYTGNITIERQYFETTTNANDGKYETKVKLEDVAPTIVITSSQNSQTNQDIILTVKVTDNFSGVNKVTYTLNGNSYNLELSNDKGTIEVSQNGIYTVYAEDNAGNKSSQVYEVTNIDKTPDNVTSVDVEGATGAENTVEYPTIILQNIKTDSVLPSEVEVIYISNTPTGLDDGNFSDYWYEDDMKIPWVLDVKDGNGEKNIYIWVSDNANNFSETPYSLTVTLDSKLIGGAANKITFSFAAIDKNFDRTELQSSQIKCKVGGTLISNSLTLEKDDTPYSYGDKNGEKFNATLENVKGAGKLTLEVESKTIYDKAGNFNDIAEFETDYVIDTNAPVITFDQNTQMYTVKDNEGNLKVILIDNEMIETTGNGVYTIEASKVGGLIRAYDKAGNVAEILITA